MTIEEIKELIQVVNESGIAELEVARGDNRVRIRRTMGSAQEVVMPAGAGVPGSTMHSMAGGAGETSSGHTLLPGAGVLDEKTAYVKSPIVGTYYDAPSPDAAAFVKVGDRISAGQVLCIIESMKLMNEIESEVSGTVIGKLVDNGVPVEYGEALFAIQPA